MHDILTTPPKFKILKTGEILDITRIFHDSGIIMGSDGTQYSEGEYELKPFTGKVDRNGEKIVWDEVDREYCISWELEGITESINCSEEYILCDAPEHLL